ncbi:hypothetical protein GCM10022258_31010 [Aquimarina gracilis]
MKKAFLTISTVFTLTLMFSVNFRNNDLVQNSAFADGICCSESGSICITLPDYIYMSSGSPCGSFDTDV